MVTLFLCGDVMTGRVIDQIQRTRVRLALKREARGDASSQALARQARRQELRRCDSTEPHPRRFTDDDDKYRQMN